MPEDRSLTDADCEAIAEKLKDRFVKDLYQDIGKGVASSIKKTILWLILVIAVYFAAKGQNLIK